MIQLVNVSKVYRTKTIETLALSNINLNIRKGEFLSVMGPSGCGKSTLLNIMGLLDDPSAGEVKINAMDLNQKNHVELAKFRNQNLGFIFQSFHLINDLNVRDNVEMPMIYRNTGAQQRRQMAESALAQVGLNNRMLHFPPQLSGGQKQRVAIARAIVGKPSIILADEPTGNLDSVMGNEIMEILLQLNREGTTIIMVTHDDRMAKKTNRLVRLFDGAQVQ